MLTEDYSKQGQLYDASEGSVCSAPPAPRSRILNQVMEANSEEFETGRRSSIVNSIPSGGLSVSSAYPREREPWFVLCMRSGPVDAFIGLIIVANAVFMGLQADYQGRHPGEDQPPIFLVMDITFNAIFVVELCMRAVALRSSFFAPSEIRWNIFDGFVVLSGAVEQIVNLFLQEGASTANVTYLRIMRILKLVRVFRIVRVVLVFRELRIMLLSVFATMRSLLWTLISLFVLTFMAGVYITATVAEKQADEFDTDLARFFGSLPRTLVALFQTTTGGIDWRDLTEELDKASPTAVVVFYLYICVVLYAIMNILTGVCVNQATKAADDDVEFVIQEELTRQNGASNVLRKFFHEADDNKSGELTWSQLQGHLRDPRVRAYFKTLGLDVWDLRTFFELLQTQEGQHVSVAIDHFVRGCLRLKGNAKSVDLLVLRHEVDDLAKSTSMLQGHIRREVRSAVSAALEAERKAASQLLHNDWA